MRRNAGCNHTDHQICRRGFLAGTAAGALAMASPVAADGLKRQQKRVLQIYLQGGVSQFESWDPKPGTIHGGPFRAIETSVPGIKICELLPYTAQRMHHLSIVRSLNIHTNDHGKGRLILETGRRNGEYPYIGAVAAKYFESPQSPLPGYIHISTRGLTDNTAAFLGARYAQMRLEGVKTPANLSRPKELTAKSELARNEYRLRLNDRFARRGQQSDTTTYNESYDQAAKLMKRKDLFEAKPSSKELERYGSHPFGRNCIFARNLLMNGSTCVKVTHYGYDTHAENFNFHIEQLDEFDRPFAMLLDDLHDSGMLDSTLVIVMSEFGRTPKINVRYGRDHWGASLSVAVGGCGINRGIVVGKTNDKGTAVADREVDGGHLFHTYFRALGLESTDIHDIPGRSIPIGDPINSAIEELLA